MRYAFGVLFHICMDRFFNLPPLSLYVHLPWCVRKCPYCDFNSYETRAALPETAYIDVLLRDLERDLPRAGGRSLASIFIGGGTPSLFTVDAIARLLAGVRSRLPLVPDCEITLEANPGTAEAERFRGYRTAGVNRLSIGVQSFEDDKLRALGRIHNGAQAAAAVALARNAGFSNINLDLMYGLPGQTPAQALQDLATAIGLAPTHISLYQLTLEPETPFYHRPPELPHEDIQFEMQQRLQAALAHAGYAQYEVSAYAQPGYACRHNLNYWTFGDYLGIGAGAHGKLSHAAGVTRLAKIRQPMDYLRKTGAAGAVAAEQHLSVPDMAFEFMMNALRLTEGFPATLFEDRTRLPLAVLEPGLQEAQRKGLLLRASGTIQPSALGRQFLNDLVTLFMPAAAPRPPAVASAASFAAAVTP